MLNTLDYFTFDGIDCRSFGIYLKKKSNYGLPSRNLTFNEVAGKSGQVVTDGDVFSNVTVSYDFFTYWKEIITPPAVRKSANTDVIKALVDWLLPHKSYLELKDSYHSGYCTKAVPVSIENVNSRAYGYVEGTIKFSRIPFWYRDDTTVSTFSLTNLVFTPLITNPEKWESSPNLHIEFVNAAGSTERDFKLSMWDGVAPDRNKYEEYVFNCPDGTSDVEINGESGNVLVDGESHNEYASFIKLPKMREKTSFTCVFPQGYAGEIRLIVDPRWRRL